MRTALTLALAAASATHAALLPAPSGTKNVTITTGELIDTTRNDPWAPTPTPRALMLSIYQPSTCNTTVPTPYMPNLTATYLTQALGTLGWPSNASFTDLYQPLCPNDGCTKIDQDAPLVMFSPGYGGSRFLYNVICADVASQGFTVVSIDPPYDALIVEYPDGHAVYQSNATHDHDTNVLVRAADVSFVLDQLADVNAVAGLLPQRGPVPFNTSHTAMFGGSLGGATAATVMINDSRILGGANYDGTFFGESPSVGEDRPFMIVAADGDGNGTSFDEFWSNLRAFKLEIEIKGIKHTGMTDAKLAAQTLGVDVNNPTFTELLGTIDGKRATEVLSAYTGAFVDMVLNGGESELLQAPSPDFPEVIFDRRSE